MRSAAADEPEASAVAAGRAAAACRARSRAARIAAACLAADRLEGVLVAARVALALVSRFVTTRLAGARDAAGLPCTTRLTRLPVLWSMTVTTGMDGLLFLLLLDAARAGAAAGFATVAAGRTARARAGAATAAFVVVVVGRTAGALVLTGLGRASSDATSAPSDMFYLTAGSVGAVSIAFFLAAGEAAGFFACVLL